MTASLDVFVAAALILLITPGPAVLFIVARSVDQGSRAGLVSVAGMLVGGIFHVAGAAFGLSAILATSAVAFTTVKYIGAGYLIYLGVRTLLNVRNTTDLVPPKREPLPTIFRQAIAVQVFNPKAALFFLAFLPQFVDPTLGSAFAQVLILGAVYHALALVTDSCYALAAGQLGGWLKRRTRVLKTQRTVSGVTYIGLGVLTATTSPTK